MTPNGLIAQAINRLQNQADVLGYDDPGFTGGLRQVAVLANGLERYVDVCTTPESATLKALKVQTMAEDWDLRFENGDTGLHLEQEMLSGHVEGQLIKMLIQITGATRVLEIGLFTGYSALAMAEALPDNGQLIALEIDAFAAAFARKQLEAAGQGGKIRVEVGPAQESLEKLSANKQVFDLVFIDADKAGYCAYLDIILGRDLLCQGGIICVDNTLMQGEPWRHGTRSVNGDAIARFNAKVIADSRVEQVLIPIRDGLTLIRRV